MYDSDSKGVSNGVGFLILLGLWIAGFILGAIASLVIALAAGGNLMDMMADMQNAQNVNMLRILQVVTTAAVFFLPAYFAAYIMNNKPWKFLGFNRRFDIKQMITALAIMFFAALVAGALAQLTELIPLSPGATTAFKEMETKYAQQVEAIAGMKNFGDYLIALFMIALLPGLFEETFFRGGMQNLLTRSTGNAWVAIIITSIIFSAVHLSFYGFLSRVCLGIVLGLIYYYSQNLWLSVIAHMFNNAIAITQMYILLQQGKSVQEAMDEKLDWWWGLIAFAALYGLFIVFKKISAQVQAAFAKQGHMFDAETSNQNQ